MKKACSKCGNKSVMGNICWLDKGHDGSHTAKGCVGQFITWSRKATATHKEGGK